MRSGTWRKTAEAYVHCLSQAFYKFGLPRGVMSDNGSPMTAGESEEGLLNLGILGPHSEAYKPNQNGKIEILWASVEGRLMAMLPTEAPLTLDELKHHDADLGAARLSASVAPRDRYHTGTAFP